MTEKLSEFRRRVARLQEEHPLWRHSTAVWNAVCYRDHGATYAQKGWQREMGLAQKIAIYGDPYSDGFDADRFVADAIAAGVLVDDANQGKFEAGLGVQTVPQVPLRWKVDGDCAVALRLGEVVIAEAYTPVDGDKAWWHVDTRYSIQPRNDDFTSRDSAMRAVEAAFGITAPLPVEGE